MTKTIGVERKERKVVAYLKLVIVIQDKKMYGQCMGYVILLLKMEANAEELPLVLNIYK